MFNCEKCGKTSKPREKANIIVVKTRPKQYPEGTIGYETVQEVKVCNDCNGGK